MSIDKNTTAAAIFYAEVRKFSLRTKPWQSAIFYHTKPDEIWDLTLVSERVYSNRDEYLAVMAVAGIDCVDMPLTQRMLVFPTPMQLYKIKQAAGFESQAKNRRKDGVPTWFKGE
jgi:hypothetical protein